MKTDITLYKLKHLPTGLYFQPHKHGGSNLSPRGKIYQTGTHGLSSKFRYATKSNELDTAQYTVQCPKNSKIHNLTKDLLVWTDCRRTYNQVEAKTFLKDWIKENIIK